MRNDAMKDGWQRFLDRLRRLWGKRADEKRGNNPSAPSPATLEPLRRPDSASTAVPAARLPEQAVPMNVWEDEGGALVGQLEGLSPGNSASPAVHS
jgi:hypothetical protein